MTDATLAGRAAGARRGRRSHAAHDRIRRDARADASSAAGLLRGKPAQQGLGAEAAMGGERAARRRHGAWRARARCRGGARAHRLRRRGMEQHARSRFRASHALRARPSSTGSSRAPMCWSACCRSRRRRAASSIAARSSGSRATASSAARSSSMRAAAGCRTRTTFSRRSTTAPCWPRRSTCSTPSRCRPDSPFWSHPKVTLSPHNAADTDPDAISVYVAEQIAAFERGETLTNVVDRSVGY